MENEGIFDKLVGNDQIDSTDNIKFTADEVLEDYPIPPLFFLTKIAELFDIPLTSRMFFTIRGSENFHIYLWIAKDFSWSQGLYYESLVFGVSALGWCTVLMYNAFRSKNMEEIYFLIPLTLWLFGNFWWMTGEIVNQDDDVRQPQAGDIMIAGICFFILYWCCLRPFNLLLVDVNRAQKYNDVGLIPRFKIFYSWRQYEVSRRCY